MFEKRIRIFGSCIFWNIGRIISKFIGNNNIGITGDMPIVINVNWGHTTILGFVVSNYWISYYSLRFFVVLSVGCK